MSAAIVLALLMLIFAFSSARMLATTRSRRRLITETPTTAACDVREGHVEVKGRIVPIETMKSPLGKKDVVYARWELQEERKLNRVNAWTTTHHAEKRIPFLLDDGTGRVRVVSDKAELMYATDSTTVAMTFDQAPPEVLALLEEAGVDSESLSGHNVRIVETYLEAGDNLYVCGLARMGRDGMAVIDDAESRQVGFLISDHREEVIVEVLRRAERSSAWGVGATVTGALVFLVIAFV